MRLNGEQRLRVAMIATPWFEIPPDGYGGTEVMCATLVDELVEQGHDVTLLGAGEPGTRAQKFIPVFEDPMIERLRTSKHGVACGAQVEVSFAAHLNRALEGLDVDVVHDHSLAGPLLAWRRRVPTVVTAHNLEGDLAEYYEALGDAISLVAISGAQRENAAGLPWAGTVHNAIDSEAFPFVSEKGDYVLFLGRISAEKGPGPAITAAQAAGVRIVLAGKCDDSDERAHFDDVVQPHLGPDVEWFGEADADAKKELLAKARCLVFPVQWEEPFGLVMAESMACGTPVVALRRGAVPEVIEDGVTGSVCDTVDELPAAIARAVHFDPHACAQRARTHFDASVMARGYERVYRQAMNARSRR